MRRGLRTPRVETSSKCRSSLADRVRSLQRGRLCRPFQLGRSCELAASGSTLPPVLTWPIALPWGVSTCPMRARCSGVDFAVRATLADRAALGCANLGDRTRSLQRGQLCRPFQLGRSCASAAAGSTLPFVPTWPIELAWAASTWPIVGANCSGVNFAVCANLVDRAAWGCVNLAYRVIPLRRCRLCLP